VERRTRRSAKVAATEKVELPADVQMGGGGGAAPPV
jgi:glutamate transport system permease protein